MSHQPFFIASTSETFPGWTTSRSAAQSMNGLISDMAGRGQAEELKKVLKENKLMCDRVTVHQEAPSLHMYGNVPECTYPFRYFKDILTDYNRYLIGAFKNIRASDNHNDCSRKVFLNLLY